MDVNLDEVADLSELTDISGTQVIINKLLSNMSDGMLKQYLNSVLPSVMSFFWSVILAIVVYGIGSRVIGLIIKIIRKSMVRHDFEAGVIQFLTSFIRAVCYVVLAIMILTLFGISASSVAAAVASLGLTAGLALQGSLSNFAGGVLILLLRPFVVGDYIREDTHGNEGTVAEITVFYTKLKTIDHKLVVIPNGPLANSSLTNFTMGNTRVVHLVVGISYQDNIKRAKQIIEDIINNEEYYIKESDMKIYVDSLGESSVMIGLRFEVPTENYWEVRWRTLETIKNKFDENGITIPFNQLDVHMVR